MLWFLTKMPALHLSLWFQLNTFDLWWAVKQNLNVFPHGRWCGFFHSPLPRAQPWAAALLCARFQAGICLGEPCKAGRDVVVPADQNGLKWKSAKCNFFPVFTTLFKIKQKLPLGQKCICSHKMSQDFSALSLLWAVADSWSCPDQAGCPIAISCHR